jgi:chemotaxis protein methyltransferase CheR
MPDMSAAALAEQDIERFRSTIVERIGLQFDERRRNFLGDVLQRRLDRLGDTSEVYLRNLQRGAPAGEIGALARELTVGETYFFRNIEQFRALAEVALPERMRIARTPRVLRLLSAGCSSGEEAYSLAIVTSETVPADWTVDIRAVDLNAASLEWAARGRYTPWALRETPGDVRSRWFRREGRDMVLDERVRSAVRFEARNLAGDDPGLWCVGAYDVIFCRNVLMYFAPDQMRTAVARMAEALAPGGFLFLGHAETLRGISNDFHLHHTHGTFYYERKHAGAEGPCRPHPPPARPARLRPSPDDYSWFHRIAEASERVTAIVTSKPENRPAPETASTLGWDPAPAFDLLRRECFGEALHYVRTSLAGMEPDADALLLEAALLAHSRQIADAQDVCHRLLLRDELNAGAHYVLGLCREHAADTEGAREHYQVAAYLDAGFAMPRLHLGLLARRNGDHDTARRELAQALALLRREEPSRLLLFGGGFNREALAALCRTSLRSCGGRP